MRSRAEREFRDEIFPQLSSFAFVISYARVGVTKARIGVRMLWLRAFQISHVRPSCCDVVFECKRNYIISVTICHSPSY